MVDYVDLHFAPDIDSAWKKNPGALVRMDAFAPLLSGAYGSIGTANYLGATVLTGTDHLTAKGFRQIDGSVRLLTFRVQNIDEYDSAGTRTNRGTAYNAATVGWDATAWGNQIIAVNKLDAPQSSTGAGFAALGGSPPKARYIASNLNYVMLYDVDDGGANVFADMIWWCGLRDPTTWAPNQATQAGWLRLLAAPGRGRGLVQFRDTFYAFKDNAIIECKWLGPPKLFGERLVTPRIGCIAPGSITELDGKLYFLHASGFWEFDGQNLRNIGLPVFQSFLQQNSFIAGLGGSARIPSVGYDTFDIAATTGAADDIEGVVWFSTAAKVAGTNAQTVAMYGYNVRTGKWGCFGLQIASTNTGSFSPLVRISTADAQAFKADTNGRVWAIWNLASPVLKVLRYPAALTEQSAAIETGIWGDQQQGVLDAQIYLRHRKGTDALASLIDCTATVTAYQSEDQTVTLGSKTMDWSPEFGALQGKLDARYKAALISYGIGKKIVLAGMALDEKATGKR